jgi:hypothetical protein
MALEIQDLSWDIHKSVCVNEVNQVNWLLTLTHG